MSDDQRWRVSGRVNVVERGQSDVRRRAPAIAVRQAQADDVIHTARYSRILDERSNRPRSLWNRARIPKFCDVDLIARVSTKSNLLA